MHVLFLKKNSIKFAFLFWVVCIFNLYSEEYISDYEKLIEELIQDSDNGYYVFSIAQNCRSLERFDEAIFWYKTRIEKEGRDDEIWFSKYMIGECYEILEEWDQALFWYLEAYQFDTRRPESLFKIAKYYKDHDQNDLAYIFAKYGSQIPFTESPMFSFSPDFYEYDFNLELSVISYYTKHKEEGLLAADEVILNPKVPWFIKEQTYKNMLFYVENLKAAKVEKINLERPIIEEGFDERYHPMNPSIERCESGYKVICRTVNYTQMGAKIFQTIDRNGIYRTRNFLLDYDRNFNLLSQKEIIEDLARERIISCAVEGLEDCRLVRFNDQYWFSCTTSDTNPTGNRQISLCKLEDHHYPNTIYVERLIPLIGPDLNLCEKNWLPFENDGQLYLIYSFDPFIVFTPDLSTGNCEKAIFYEPVKDFSRFRGSAPPIPFDGGYLAVSHEVVLQADFTRCYLHRFVYLDQTFQIKKVSKPFTFKHQGVEFCCSSTVDHSGSQLILSVGIEDREAYLFFVDLETVRSLLMPISG